MLISSIVPIPTFLTLSTAKLANLIVYAPARILVTLVSMDILSIKANAYNAHRLQVVYMDSVLAVAQEQTEPFCLALTAQQSLANTLFCFQVDAF
jgi:hypothetical protein